MVNETRLIILDRAGQPSARSLIGPLDEKEEAAGGGMWKYELTAKGKRMVPVAGKLEDDMGRFWTTLEKD